MSECDISGVDPADLLALGRYHRKYPDDPMDATLRRRVFSDEGPERPDAYPAAEPCFHTVQRYVTEGYPDPADVDPLALKTALIYGPHHTADGERPVSAFALLFPDVEGVPAVAWVGERADHTRGEWRVLSSRLVYARRLDAADLTDDLHAEPVRVVRTVELDDAARWYIRAYRDVRPDRERDDEDADDGADGADAPEDSDEGREQSGNRTEADAEP